MRINQQKIARELQLSPATVSRSLRGSQEINAETRERVLEAARKLGYRFPTPVPAPEESAGKSLGVLIYGAVQNGNFVPQHFLQGMSEAAHKAQVSLVVHYVSTRDRDLLNDPQHQPVALRNGQLSGLLFIRHFPAHILENFAANLPCITLTHYEPSMAIDCVDNDQVLGIGRLMEHLVEHGHRRIGFYGDCGNLSWNQARFTGYLQALVRLGLPYQPEWCLNVGPNPVNEVEAADRIAGLRQEGVTAWVCANDLVGYQLMVQLEERGVSVPRDLSVTGFDAIMPLYGCPQITCVRPQFEEMGASAVRRVLERIREPELPPQRVLLGCDFVAGHTVASPTG